MKGDVAATVEVAAAGAEGGDELLGADNPADAPTREAEAFGQAVDEKDVVSIHVNNVGGGGEGTAVTVGAVIVAGIELIEDERCAVL